MTNTEISPTITVYTELQQAFNHFNSVLFDSELPECILTLQRKNQICGYYSCKRFIKSDGSKYMDEIAINPSFFAISPIVEVLQTVVHEMCHAWQYHCGKPSRRSYHNKQWASKMIAVGLMPSDTGEPGGKITGQKMSDYPIEKGRFLKSCDELITQDFKLSWFDRIPPQNSRLIHEMLAEASRVEEHEHESNTVSLPGLSGELVLSVSADNRSNRSKYRCPSCGVQVWGKPKLSILCGSCGGTEMEVYEIFSQASNAWFDIIDLEEA